LGTELRVKGRPALVIEGPRNLHYVPLTDYVFIPSSTRWARPADPVFHWISQGEFEDRWLLDNGDEGRLYERSTSCARVVHRRSWIRPAGGGGAYDYEYADMGLQIPVRWAMAFARPCRICFT
jgi:hypothetical protein